MLHNFRSFKILKEEGGEFGQLLDNIQKKDAFLLKASITYLVLFYSKVEMFNGLATHYFPLVAYFTHLIYN